MYELPPLWKWQADELADHGLEPKRAIFASPRLGKSRVAAEGLLAAHEARSIVLAPLSVCPQWIDVLQSVLPQEPLYQGWGLPGATIRTMLKSGCSGILVLSDSMLAPCIDECLAWLGDGALIVDESHRFAGVSTKRGRAMRRLAWKASYVRLLSGTPGPNHMGNLWGQMVALDKDRWDRSYERFANRFLIRDAMFPTKVLGVRNRGELQAMLLERASIVRREDVFGADSWQFVVRELDMPFALRKMYDTLARKWVLDAPKVSVENAAVRLLRLQQFTAGHLPHEEDFMQYTEVDVHDIKIAACIDDLEEIVDSEEKAVVFYKFRREGDRMVAAARKAFPHIPVLQLGGDTSTADRERVYATIEKCKGAAIAVVQTEAGGIGRSFAEAGYVHFLSEGFSFMAHEQARDRVYKPGVPRVVTSYRIRNTVDQFVGKALERKQNVHNLLRTADIEEWVGCQKI